MKLFNKIALLSVGAGMAIAGGVAATFTTKAAKADGTGTFSEFAGDIVEGDYVVYYNGYAMQAAKNGTASRLNCVSVTPAGGAITNPDASLVWHIAPSDSYWTLYNASTESYASGNGTKNQAILKGEVDDGALWTITMSSGKFEMVNHLNETKNVAKNLRENGTYGFACYSTGTGGALSLYKSSSGEDPDTLSGVATADTFFVGKAGTTLNVEPAAIPSTASDVLFNLVSNNTGVATVTNAGVVTAVAPGVATIAVTAYQPDSGEEFTKDVKVAVTTHAGTEADPFTADDAIIVADARGASATADKYYVQGIIESLQISGGQATYNITSGDKVFKAYRTNGFDNTASVTEATLHNGDTVTVYGAIQLYNDKTLGNISEITYGKLVSVQSSLEVTSIAITGDVTKEVYVGEEFDISELKVIATYSDSSTADVTEAATITLDKTVASVEGTETIHVNASYSGVNAPERAINVTVNKLAEGEVKTTIVVKTYADANGWTNSTKYMSISASGITITHDKPESTNSGKYYTGNGTWRFYQNEDVTVTIAVPDGTTIKSIKPTYSVGNTGVLTTTDGTQIASEEMFEVNAATLALKVGNTGSATNGNVQISSIEIVTVTGSSTELTAADVAEQIKTLAGGWNNIAQTSNCANNYATAKTALLALSSAELETFKTSSDAEIAAARATYETWCDRNGDENPYAGSVVTSTRAVTMTSDSSILVIAICIASVSLLGAALILKKKKLAK